MKNIFYTKTMINLLLKQGHIKKAKNILKELVKIKPDDFELLSLAQEIKNKTEIKNDNYLKNDIIRLPKPQRMDLVTEETFKSSTDLRKTDIIYRKISVLKFYLKGLNVK